MLMKGHASIEERRERGKNGKKKKKKLYRASIALDYLTFPNDEAFDVYVR